MNTIAFIRQSLESTKGFASGLLMDLQDAPLAQPTSAGGNHALWIVTHLAFSEAQLFDVFIHGRKNRYEDFGKSVGLKSVPTTSADDYPSMEEAVAMFDSVRQDVLQYLDTIDDEALDAKSHAPDDFGDGFGTVAKCLGAMVMHAAIHAGQLTVIRRSLGREPVMA